MILRVNLAGGQPDPPDGSGFLKLVAALGFVLAMLVCSALVFLR